jgi:hypothetical protein
MQRTKTEVPMATVSERIKDTYEQARTQFNGFEKQVEKKVAKLEKDAKARLEEVKGQLEEVPDQLRGQWDKVVGRLRSALAFATREELEQLGVKVEDLAKKVDKLIRGDKIKAVANNKSGKKQ